MTTEQRNTESTTLAESPSLMEAINQYFQTVSPQDRPDFQAELLRFARWYGADRTLKDMRGHNVASYTETISAAAPDTARRLEALRSFFAFLKKNNWHSTSLATHVRLRKTAPEVKKAAQQSMQEIKLTAEGHASLKEELETLIQQRPQIAADLQKAMADKDFRENAPLDAMREYQAHHEARIRELQTILKQAVVVEAGSANNEARVSLGTAFVLRNVKTGEVSRYTLVGPNEVNTAQRRISVLSPVGKAVVERTVGEEIEVKAPVGAIHFIIEAIEA